MGFTKCEVEIMTCFWRIGRNLTPEEVWAGIYVLHEKYRDLHVISKYLEHLVHKGLVKKYFDGDKWIYQPLIGQEEALKTLMADYSEILDRPSKTRIRK